MDSAAVAFTTLDYLIFGVYLFVIVGLGLWVSQEEEGRKTVPTTSWPARRSRSRRSAPR